MTKLIQSIYAGELTLLALSEHDLESTLRWRNRDDARKWFKNAATLEREQHEAWFRKYVDRADDVVLVAWVGGERVGQVSVYDIDMSAASAEVGRFLAAPEFSGRGFIFKSCEALIEHCRTVLGLKYLYLDVFPNNEKAIKIYHALGFVDEPRDGEFLRMGLQL